MFKSHRMGPQKKKNPLLKFLKFVIIVGIIIGFIFYYGYSNFKSEPLIDKEIFIKIDEGETMDKIPEKLGINYNYFKIYTKLNNINIELKTGSYRIKEKSDIKQIVESLKKPVFMGEINLTLLEGWNIYDIDEYLVNKGLINEGEYIKYVTNSEKIEKLTEFYSFIKGLNTLEGYLYPDTYTIDADNFKINNLVTKQLDSFENKVYKKILENLNNDKIEKLVNLASIVEKEERNTDEKAKVAGILKKRLENNWFIGADATVCYPHELTSQECKHVVSKYIKEKSDYNTRTMKGLPKTPIGNPSFDTINATLNYKETPYWFYLHDSNGKIHYAETNEEHNVNKEEY